MSISDIFDIGRQGLSANRQGLQTTSQNIANVNTPGYTRQRAVFQQREQSSKDGLFFGGGVEVSKVMRLHDSFVDRQIVDESKNLGFQKANFEGLRTLESSATRYKVNESIQGFFNSFRELSINPEQPSLKLAVRESGKAVAQTFAQINSAIESQRQDLDLRLTSIAEDINKTAKELAQLNDKIVFFERTGHSPNELMDRRETLLRDLSEKLGFSVSVNERGQLSLNSIGGGILLDGDTANSLVVSRSKAEGGKREGSLDLFVQDSLGKHKVTHLLKEGEVGGILHVRDTVLSQAQDKIDEIAYLFTKKINEVHSEAMSMPGEGGRGFFMDLEGKEKASQSLKLNPEIEKNPALISTGLPVDGEFTGEGDNRGILKILDLEKNAIISFGGAEGEEGGRGPQLTIQEAVNGWASEIGHQTQEANNFLSHQKSILEQLNNYRESVSGVSMEEEAINLMQYQAMFNASAKAMKVGDELLQTILSIKN